MFSLLCFQLSAQTLKGNIRDEVSNAPLYPVTVVNLRTDEATYTNEQGDFSIYAEAGDKIAFSYIGYKSTQYTMPISSGTYTVNLKLGAVTYNLREVTIMPDYTPYQVDSIERKQTYKPALSMPHASPIASPFSYIAEKFSKKSKRTFRFQKNFQKWEKDQFVDTRYTPELVAEQTGLEGDSIGHFMNAYPMPYDYARGASDMEMKMWIRYNYRQWTKKDTIQIPQVKDSLLNYESEQR